MAKEHKGIAALLGGSFAQKQENKDVEAHEASARTDEPQQTTEAISQPEPEQKASAEPQQKKQKGRGRPSRGEEWTKATIVVNKSDYSKIQEIGRRYGLQTKDIVAVAISNYIAQFEAKHGQLQPGGKARSAADLI